MFYRHMCLVWKATKSNLGWSIEADVPRCGPAYNIARVHPALPDDDSGEQTARMIVDEHNRALAHKCWSDETRKPLLYIVVTGGLTVNFDASNGFIGARTSAVWPGELLAVDRVSSTCSDMWVVGCEGRVGRVATVPPMTLEQLIENGMVKVFEVPLDMMSWRSAPKTGNKA